MSQKLTTETEIVKKLKKQKLSNTEEKIYRYIRLKPDKVILMNLKELSNKLNVSGGSILNFCRNVLKLEGFSELKLQIAEDLSKANSTKPEVANSIFEAKEYEFKKMYENIVRDIDDEKLKKANELLSNANNILIIDTENGGLSKIAEHLLYEKGLRNVDRINSYNYGLTKLLHMKDNDLLFVISSENNNISNYTDQIEVSNSKIITIVENRLNKLSQNSDLAFYTRIENREMRFSAFITYLELIVSFINI